MSGLAARRHAGDRFRGSLFLLRIAAATKRVMLIDWTDPVDFVNFMAPNKIDWRITPELQPALANRQYFHFGLPSPGPPAEVGDLPALWCLGRCPWR